MSATASAAAALAVPAATEFPPFGQDPWWLVVLKVVAIFVGIVLLVLLTIWVERRVVARMQTRLGPNRVGPFGLLQGLIDGVKLALKEDILPTAADKAVFILAPIISAIPAFLALAVIPFGPEVSIFGTRTPLQLTDFPVSVLYVLAIASIGIYGIVFAGWSSGSTYPLLGWLRSSAQMISYEIAMGLSFVAVFLYAGSMSTSQIVDAQQPMWFARDPAAVVHHLRHRDGGRDQPRAVRPPRGRGRARRRLPHRVLLAEVRPVLPGRVHQHGHRLGAGDHAVPRRLAGPLADLGDLRRDANDGWWPLLWFFAKVLLFLFMFIWLRGTLPRLRYDQFMKFGWKVLIPVSLAWIVLVATFRGLRNELDATHHADRAGDRRRGHRVRRLVSSIEGSRERRREREEAEVVAEERRWPTGRTRCHRCPARRSCHAARPPDRAQRGGGRRRQGR